MTKAAIISLKFHPGHYSHLIANYHLLRQCDVECVLYVNTKFNDLDTTSSINKVNNLFLSDYKEYDFAFFWFPSHLNLLEIFKFRILGSAKIVYVFHEPIENYNVFYKSGFNLLKLSKLFLIDIINKLTITFASHVILPSEKALSIYEKKYYRFNKEYSAIPLLFDDENNSPSSNLKSRKYISYIGTIASDHAFHKFCNFIEFAIRNDLFQEFCFLIATGSRISNELKMRFQNIQNCSRLTIIDGVWLSNHEINHYFKSSVLIWNAYDRSSQSGVLPKAFMFSTPVIGNAQISNEYIIDGFNGIYLKNNSDISEITIAIYNIIDNFNHYSKNSRKTFLNKFYYNNYIAEFTKIMKYE